jgi:hypothetical protein
MKTLGGGIKAVIGFRKGGGSSLQSILFPRSIYTLAKAKTWIKAHNYTVHEVLLVNDIIYNTNVDNNITFVEEVLNEEVQEENLPKIKRNKWWWLLE